MKCELTITVTDTDASTSTIRHNLPSPFNNLPPTFSNSPSTSPNSPQTSSHPPSLSPNLPPPPTNLRKCDACYSKGRTCVRPSRESSDQRCEQCKFNNTECSLQRERIISTKSEDEESCRRYSSARHPSARHSMSTQSGKGQGKVR